MTQVSVGQETRRLSWLQEICAQLALQYKSFLTPSQFNWDLYLPRLMKLIGQPHFVGAV